MNNPQLIQWKEFNTTIKQRINTLYSINLNHAEAHRFCAYLKSMELYPSQNTIDDNTLKREYILWCDLDTPGQIEYLNLVASTRQMRPREETDEDPINITN
jgi:hypothetical protein